MHTDLVGEDVSTLLAVAALVEQGREDSTAGGATRDLLHDTVFVRGDEVGPVAKFDQIQQQAESRAPLLRAPQRQDSPGTVPGFCGPISELAPPQLFPCKPVVPNGLRGLRSGLDALLGAFSTTGPTFRYLSEAPAKFPNSPLQDRSAREAPFECRVTSD